MSARLATQRSNNATPAQRVYTLVRFPFSPRVREHTLRQLLDDPETRELTRNELLLLGQSALRTPQSAITP